LFGAGQRHRRKQQTDYKKKDRSFHSDPIPNFSIEKFAPKGLCEQILNGFARLYKVVPDFAPHILVQEKFGMTSSPEIAKRFRGLNPGHAKHGTGQSRKNSVRVFPRDPSLCSGRILHCKIRDYSNKPANLFNLVKEQSGIAILTPSPR
jgi:hypothetical protein